MELDYKQDISMAFKKVRPGDIFEKEDNFYLKIEPCEKNNLTNNCVDLKDGKVYFFCPDDEVVLFVV